MVFFLSVQNESDFNDGGDESLLFSGRTGTVRDVWNNHFICLVDVDDCLAPIQSDVGQQFGEPSHVSKNFKPRRRAG